MPSLKDYVRKALEQGFAKEELVSELLRKGYSKEEIKDAFETRTQIQNSNRPQAKLSIIDKIKLIFSNPVLFFQSVNENTIKNSFLIYIIVSAIISLINISLSFILSSVFSYGLIGYGIGLLFYPVFLGIGLILTFVYAGITHLAIKLLKGEGSYVNTYNVTAYSLVPFLIISIIPFIGFLSFIYSIVLMTIGLSIQHNISKGKAFISSLMPVIIFFILIIFLIIYLLSQFRGFGF